MSLTNHNADENNEKTERRKRQASLDLRMLLESLDQVGSNDVNKTENCSTCMLFDLQSKN